MCGSLRRDDDALRARANVTASLSQRARRLEAHLAMVDRLVDTLVDLRNSVRVHRKAHSSGKPATKFTLQTYMAVALRRNLINLATQS